MISFKEWLIQRDNLKKTFKDKKPLGNQKPKVPAGSQQVAVGQSPGAGQVQ